jgi:hypothetical protein
MRKVPTLNMQTTNARALDLRKKMEEKICVQATQTDDPWLLSTVSYVRIRWQNLFHGGYT